MTWANYIDIGIKLISSIGIVAIISSCAWVVRRTFKLGTVVQRLDTIEVRVNETNQEVHQLRNDLNKRIDNLVAVFSKRPAA